MLLPSLQFPCHLPTCSHHMPPNHRTYPHLYYTHMHYSIYSCSCLVPYGYAVASYHIPLTYLSITHLFPLVLYTFLFGALPNHHPCFRYITFHPHQRPYASFPNPILYLASFTISDIILRYRLRLSPIYKPLSRHLCLLSLT
jgi:hypothetical protein